MNYRKAEALLNYTILIAIVTLAIVTMGTYLRRSIQAKVRDLADEVIYDKQLASLNDPDTEKSKRTIISDEILQETNGIGGIHGQDQVSNFVSTIDHEVENLEQVDYGRTVPAIGSPPTSPPTSPPRGSNSGDNSNGRDSGGGPEAVPDPSIGEGL